MPAAMQVRPAFFPLVPQALGDLGIPPPMVLDLILRRLAMEGQTNLAALSRALKLSLCVIEKTFQQMRQQQLCEVKGMVGNDYTVSISGIGRALAHERTQISRYAGAAPVSLRDYHQATKTQAAQVDITRQVLRAALSDLVVTDALLDRLGPAIISQTSMFLYGPTGNGKTSLAERLLRVYHDAILILYAVEVDGQIISVYDPAVHQKVEIDDEDLDPRWVLCRRPCILVGGELVAEMLDLRLDDASGTYSAPMQMKANNGIFIIDDFGRQLMSPRDLLNRWIVPLDRRVDYLVLRYGVKFQVPFEVMVVFATNLEPSGLADDAFLRRIHNKIYVEPVESKTFDEISRRVAMARNLACEPGSVEHFRDLCLKHGRADLRACYPSDIFNILVSIGKYEKRPPQINAQELGRAVDLYFTKV